MKELNVLNLLIRIIVFSGWLYCGVSSIGFGMDNKFWQAEALMDVFGLLSGIILILAINDKILPITKEGDGMDDDIGAGGGPCDDAGP